jgi:hypothetical protein
VGSTPASGIERKPVLVRNPVRRRFAGSGRETHWATEWATDRDSRDLGREALVTSRIETNQGPLAALLEVADRADAAYKRGRDRLLRPGSC